MSETLTHDLDQASAAELARAVAARAVSALELTDAAIARIEARDVSLNAVVVRDFERARQTARAIDAGGRTGPLLGVPMTVKEAHDVEGLPTTWGLEAARDFIAPRDSVGVARLKAAGAVILGKTNVPPFLSDWQSANPVYGRTNNPWDLSRTPGGSSGGSGAALAAGMVPLEFGSDIGGSIRIPSAFCGVYGHKPTYDLIPQRGHAPPGTDGAGTPLGVIGPMARTAGDLALALGVLAGPDGPEARAFQLNLPPRRHASLGDYRVLVIDSHPGAPLEAEIAEALHGLAERLERQGAQVDRGSDLLPDLAAAHELYGQILNPAMSRGAPGAQNIPNAHQWLDLLDAQTGVRRRWDALFQTYDVVLAPVLGTLAFPHDDSPHPSQRSLIVNGAPTPYFGQLVWPGMAILGHLPATAAPIGISRSGLPIGIQIIGGEYDDLTTIGFAALLEQAFGGFQPPPAFRD